MDRHKNIIKSQIQKLEADIDSGKIPEYLIEGYIIALELYKLELADMN